MAILSTTPLDFKLDDNGDLDFSNGGPSMVTGVDGVAQLCGMALKAFAGEWFADRTVGIPYYDNEYVPESVAILAQKFDENKVLRSFSRELLKVPGVSKVTSLTVTFDNKIRKLSVTFEVVTAFGDTVNDDIILGV